MFRRLFGRLRSVFTQGVPVTYNPSLHYNCFLEMVENLYRTTTVSSSSSIPHDIRDTVYQRLRKKGEIWTEGCLPDGRLQLIVSDLDAGYEAVSAVLHERQEAQLVDVFAKALAKISQISGTSEGRTESVKFLLDCGADVDTEIKDGITWLMWAASEGETEMVKFLLYRGADVNTKDAFGKTALMRAAWEVHTEIVKLLLDKGADVGLKLDDGITALMVAAIKGDTGIVKLLLDKGADVNAKDEFGLTALTRAAAEGHEEVVTLLTQRAVSR